MNRKSGGEVKKDQVVPAVSRAGFAQLTAILFLLPLYPFLSMIWYHRYPVFSPEVLILLMAFAVFALTMSWLLGKTSLIISNLVLVLGLALVALIQFNLLFIGMLIFIGVATALAVLFGRKFQVWLPWVLATLLLGAWLDNTFLSHSPSEISLATSSPTSGGPVIHLLMDGFIGPDGLARDDQSQILRDEMIAFFQQYDFRLYTRSYSHYAATADSMTRLFNFRNDDKNIFLINNLLREPTSFDENEWFDSLVRSGRNIIIYQTDSIDFCAPSLQQNMVCNVFPQPNLNSVHTAEKNPVLRAIMLVRNLVNQSAIIAETYVIYRILPFRLEHVTVFDQRILDQLAEDVLADPSNAYFAHVLIPHAPVVYRENCTIDYGSPQVRLPWSEVEKRLKVDVIKAENAKMQNQVRCAMTVLGDLFDKLENEDLYERATIIVHGDHGTSLFQTVPMSGNMEDLTYRDMNEAFSALFAIKFPNGEFELIEEVRSLNVLMAESALSIVGDNLDESDIEVLSEPEPFVYLGGASPMTKVYINIFDTPEQSGEQEQEQEAQQQSR